VDFFVGVFTTNQQAACSVLPGVMARLAALGVPLVLDVYGD
jgi:hypothetical protein